MANEHTISVRAARDEDLAPALALVLDVFNRHVAPHYTRVGVDEFHRYVDLDAVRARLRTTRHERGDDSLSHADEMAVAVVEGRIVGLAEVRGSCHLSMLFVDTAYQGRGIGRALVDWARSRCIASSGRQTQGGSLTVNASPNAVGAYLGMGFNPAEPEQSINGIRFVPMRLPLPDPA